MVDDFVTSLRKEATVQSGRGNLYRGKTGRPTPNYSRSSTSLGAVVLFLFKYRQCETRSSIDTYSVVF